MKRSHAHTNKNNNRLHFLNQVSRAPIEICCRCREMGFDGDLEDWLVRMFEDAGYEENMAMCVRGGYWCVSSV